MADAKVKAESEDRVVEVSPLLSIDSGMVIWFTDLDALGLGGGGGGGGGGNAGGGGGGGGEPSGGGEPPVTEVEQFIATCDAVFHGPEIAGAQKDGRWFGSLVSSFEEAHAAVHEHADGLAYIGLYVNGVIVGPVSHH